MTALFIDGAPATLDQLAHVALVNYGAYTSFRVEDGAVRGLDRHVARLQRAAIELFGEQLDEAELRLWMRQALGDRAAAWLRLSLFSPQITARAPGWVGRPSVMISVSDAPAPLADRPWRVQPQVHTRAAPHLKHVATFDLIHARRQARAAGFDDALLIDARGVISEGTSWNIGFWRGDDLVLPQAPMLQGVTQALLAEALGGSVEPVALGDLGAFDAAFLCNSATPACAISAIGDHAFAGRPDRIALLNATWAASPGQAI